jgi:hypothetical protein
MIGNDFDSQAFAVPPADMDGFELTALYTLQDGLSRHAEPQSGLEHRHVTGWVLLDEASPQLVGDANAPGGTGGELFADDDSGGQPAVQRGRCDPEDLGCLLDGDQFADRCWGRRCAARDAAIAAQAADVERGERVAACRAPSFGD